VRSDRRAAEFAHHAEQAGATADLVGYSVKAAEEAAALGAYREAMAHLSRAIKHGAQLPDDQRAKLLERKAFAAFYCGAFNDAMQALDDAMAIHRRAGNVLGVGDALRIAGHVQWNLGDPALAEANLSEAVRILEAEPDSWQYAIALASQSQFDMLADRNAKAIPAAEEALARAKKLGRWDICLQALTYLRTTLASTNLDEGLPAIRATIEEASAREELDALPRLYANLTSVMTAARRYDGLLEAFDEGVAICTARDQPALEGLIRGNRANAFLDMGRLGEAVSEAEYVLYGPYPKGAGVIGAMIALSRARVRLGLPEGGVLDQARRLPTAQRDLLRRAPLAIADAEAHWLEGSRPGAEARLAAVMDAVVEAWSQLWHIGEAAFWLSVVGQKPKLPAKALARIAGPQRAYLDGRWRDAARGWADLGCPYEQAISLTEGGESEKREALVIFDRLGAVPAARMLRRRMRSDGVRSVPAGPRTGRRLDPAGLTRRQNEVLGLLAAGLSNSEIADRLGLSEKTVEHHVSAVLAALDAPSRLAAVQIARERGLEAVADG
jgi:DNA-binding CsgD family transcriptional regulator/tetratricopeptide (TPR) repeat protein